MFRNALQLPNLVGRTPDQVKCNAGVEGHAGVNWGQPGVILFRNALRLPNWLEELLTKVKCNAVVEGHAGVKWGQPGSNCSEMLYDYQI